MENIEEILKGYELPDEAKAEIAKKVAENYRTVAETKAKAVKIAELTEANGTLSEELAKVKELDGTNAQALEEAKQRIAGLEEAADKAKKAAEAKQAAEAFRQDFDKQKEGRSFVSPIVEEAVFGRALDMHTANPDMGVEAIMQAVTAGDQGIWANPQRDPRKMPAGEGASGSPAIGSLEQVKGMSAAEINANWATIQKLLEQKG